MADEKMLSSKVAAEVVMHLNEFGRKVSEIVADYKKINEATDTSQEVKNRFAVDCMYDVAVLNDYLVEVLTKTIGGQNAFLKSVEPRAAEADIIELDAYRANGGLPN